MAGGAPKFRHLSVKSSHRQALLRNLVSSLIEHESITTTYAKAKEAQRFAEKLISLGKRNTEAAKNRAKGILYRPVELMPKLFGPLRERYAARPGGYTRVLRVEPHKEDQSDSAILELVDGNRDMRFAITAKILATERAEGRLMNTITAHNVKKVTAFRPDGTAQLEAMVKKIEGRTKEAEDEWEDVEEQAVEKDGEGMQTKREAVEERRRMGEVKKRVYKPYDTLGRGQETTMSTRSAKRWQEKQRRERRQLLKG